MDDPSPENPSRRETWIRLLFVILFAFIYGVAEVVLFALIVLQFGFKLITGNRNESLLQFSAGLNRFFYQILQFITFNSDNKPFPFSNWPDPVTEGIAHDQNPD
jgi:hypothetical protein